MNIRPLAGKPAASSMLIDVPQLVTAYSTHRPDPMEPEQHVAFGTSGHRGSALRSAFNEWHILAITQAIYLSRQHQGIDGQLFLGMDTHALSVPAFASALETVAAKGVDVMIAESDEYTPTPAIPHASLTYNRGHQTGLADGIVITPSHKPPDGSGFKSNPPHGGSAGSDVTAWIEAQANAILQEAASGLHHAPPRLLAKTLVSSQMMDRIAGELGRRLYEVPVASNGSLTACSMGHWDSLAKRARAHRSSAVMARSARPIRTASYHRYSRQRSPHGSDTTLARSTVS